MSEQQILQFFSDITPAMHEACDPAVLREIEKAKSEGFHTVLLSGTYENMLAILGEILGIDTVIGTKMLFQNELVDTIRPLDIISGAAKLDKIKEVFTDQEIDWQASRSYADSISDLAILELVGEPVAVKPDNLLKTAAVKKGWRIIE